MKIHLLLRPLFMKKILLTSITSLLLISLFGQNNPTPENPKKKQTINLTNRANDHLMIQIGSLGWSGKPDSIKTKGLSRSLNLYFLFDFPFKTNPHFSAAIGAGIGSDQIFFDKTYVGIKDATTILHFTNQADTNHFKKTKLITTYLEAPVELRYTVDPQNNGKSLKIALGAKVGTLLNAHTRSKDLVTKSGAAITTYVQKESSKKFFNGNRLVLTARVGWGHFSLFGSYQAGILFKNATAGEIHPRTIGLTISGL
jgi:hypothetical protein